LKKEAKIQNERNEIKIEKNKIVKNQEKDLARRKRSDSSKNEQKKENLKKSKPLRGVTGES